MNIQLHLLLSEMITLDMKLSWCHG